MLVGRLSSSGIEMIFTVNFFQGELLGFSDEAEDHEPGYEVETSIEAD
jgi:hypothetical protein